MPKPLAITCGDPAGVGPEIIAAWLQRLRPEERSVVVLGPASWLRGLPVPGIPVGSSDFVLRPGQPSAEGARIALEAMEQAAAGCVSGEFAAVVTAPVSKAQLVGIGYPFPGQTEFFADRWGGEPTMGFVGARLRVILATWHIPLLSVPETLRTQPQLLERAVTRAAELAQALGHAQPRLGVCGLNPHAGEGGILGTEERDFLDPQLDRLRRVHPGLSRCLPGDTVFHRQLQGDFDVTVALYHDQGLAPLKTLEFDSAVNVTLGLPYVRTSPDHGTGFDIAGQGRARPESFIQAVELARRLTQG